MRTGMILRDAAEPTLIETVDTGTWLLVLAVCIIVAVLIILFIRSALKRRKKLGQPAEDGKGPQPAEEEKNDGGNAV